MKGGLAALAVAVVGVVVRVAVGLRESLDGDEAVEAITALRILHGQFALMESSGRYLGALDSYMLAPFLAVLGPKLFAVRLAEGLVGGAYVLLTYALGRVCFRSTGPALVAAGVAAVFPLFALTFGVRARTYGLLLALETLVLLLALRLAWPERRPGRRAWALAGLTAGLAVWTHLLLALPVVAGLAAVLARGRVNVWRPTKSGLAVAGFWSLVGLAPWLVYNAVVSPLGSLRHLYSPAVAYTVSPGLAARAVAGIGLPIFVGADVGDCGLTSAPALGFDAGLATLVLAVLWLRRRSLAALATGRLAELEPVDFVLAVAPAAVLAVTLGFNTLVCEPRYLMPLAVPLAMGGALVLAAPWPWRALGLLLAAAWLAAAGVTLRSALGEGPNLIVTSAGARVPVDGPTAAAALAAERPEAVWADYQLARTLQFYAGDRFVVGEYQGYVGFPDTQARAYAAHHPSWLFAAGDPEIAAFQAECARRGITYRTAQPAPSLVLFASLSAPLTPDDLHLGGQRLKQV
jgi:hypothetical protein